MSSKLNVLVVEDDEIELLKFKMVTDGLGLDHHYEYVTDGERAIDYLRYKSTVLPQLILLDLNMPRFDGLEFLSMMRSDADLRYIPTVIMTSSENVKDIKKCYELGIAGYLTKPLDLEQYQIKLKALFGYWELNKFYIAETDQQGIGTKK